MDIFLIMMFALCAMGYLAIFSVEPVRRTFLEGMAISLLFGFSFILTAVIYLGIQAY